jgi:hypothetical protein
MTPYTQGYQDQLEKLGLAMPGFMSRIGTGAKNLYNNARYSAAKVKNLGFNEAKKDTGFGPGNFGPVDSSHLEHAMMYNKLNKIPATTGRSGILAPSGADMNQRIKDSYQQLRRIHEAKGTPLRVRPESELRAESDVRREFALHGGFNAPMTPKSHSFSHYDDWGSVAPNNSVAAPSGGFWSKKPTAQVSQGRVSFNPSGNTIVPGMDLAITRHG